MSEKHVELKALYAQDAVETDRPWKRWQWAYTSDENPVWRDCKYPIAWHEGREYRRKHDAKRGHKHAHLMALYANDAAETDKPWERWEYKDKNDGSRWWKCDGSPLWFVLHDYRRKPAPTRTMTIAGIEVPMPLMEAPEYRTTVYVPQPLFGAVKFEWVDNDLNKLFLELGRVHITREGALAHNEAMNKVIKDAIAEAQKGGGDA
ncbi:MAG: hypothetical protein FWC38_00440 [Proteobacteria bacterium]|nr:hypothetical protein [Pseudomonadota bacterium]MCL2306710.1 hypothetical protein [Pseudomonadota bacterium]